MKHTLWTKAIAAISGALKLAAVILMAGAFATQISVAPATASDVELLKQPWFHQSFLDLKEDLSEAAATGKGLIVAFEQAGCPYCREMHRVNLKDKETVAYLREKFHLRAIGS